MSVCPYILCSHVRISTGVEELCDVTRADVAHNEAATSNASIRSRVRCENIVALKSVMFWDVMPFSLVKV
jgi:hypothetical protein